MAREFNFAKTKTVDENFNIDEATKEILSSFKKRLHGKRFAKVKEDGLIVIKHVNHRAKIKYYVENNKFYFVAECLNRTSKTLLFLTFILTLGLLPIFFPLSIVFGLIFFAELGNMGVLPDFYEDLFKRITYEYQE